MTPKSMIAILFALLACGGSFGCAEVKPWQKANFARSHMAFEPDRAEARLIQHAQESKEAASGGYGIGGGGCGCK